MDCSLCASMWVTMPAAHAPEGLLCNILCHRLFSREVGRIFFFNLLIFVKINEMCNCNNKRQSLAAARMQEEVTGGAQNEVKNSANETPANTNGAHENISKRAGFFNGTQSNMVRNYFRR